MDYTQILIRDGVVVVPAFDMKDVTLYNSAFWQTVQSFPEYLDTSITVQGAFGALGNPASFHNPVVRHIRMNMMFRAVPILKGLAGRASPEKNIEQLVDRMSIRRRGTTLGKETWHRDVSPAPPGDVILGGWVNLDTEGIQRFSCIPGSHVSQSSQTGFVKETSVDETKKRVYTIPPGHWIVFYQNILHEVLPGKVQFDSIRLFVGFRLTSTDQPLFNHDRELREQGVMHLPSGQMPTMWSPNHLAFHSKTVIPWSQSTFKPQCLEVKNTPKLGEFIIVHKVMHSLTEYGLPLYPEYSQEELSILRPAREWTLSGIGLTY